VTKALITEKEKVKIPIHLLKFFIFNLGVIYKILKKINFFYILDSIFVKGKHN